MTTHFLPPLVIGKKCSAPIGVVITDYHAHKIWLAPNVKNFFAASDDVQKELAGAGLNSTVTGLPIHPKFFIKKDPAEIKKNLGLDNSLPTILIMPVTKGKIKIEEMIEKLFCLNANIIAISGKLNDRLFDKLERMKSKAGRGHFFIYKKSNKIDELMRIADCIISKAGGLTISEAIFLGKKLLVVNPIPGQEEYNVEFLEKNGYGREIKSVDDGFQKLCGFLKEPENKQPRYAGLPNDIILQTSLGPTAKKSSKH